MYERILVPLDGSKVGEGALPHVEELVSKLSPEVKAEVTLLQVVSPLSHYIVAGEAGAQIPYTPQEMAQIKKRAMGYLDKAGEGLRGTKAVVNIKVAVGNAAEEIMKAAEEIKADLIAMSTHGRSGISRWAFGSVTDRVLRGANVPILLVRAPKGIEQA
jgi:nucleotide-binding universal stress UspA family protein